MIFLVEIDAYNRETGQVETQYFGSDGYTTKPNDDIPNVSFDNRLIQPGNYQRNVFGAGTTGGDSQVAAGFLELANPDGEIDYLADMPVDGRSIRIWGIEDIYTPFSERQLLFVGSMDQLEFSWLRVTVQIRDRLFELREDIQKNLFAGTTTAGGMNQAEGTPEDLKDKPKPLLFGRVLNLSPPLSNQYDLFYTVADNGFSLSNISVKDGGIPLTFTANYATIAQLRTATLTVGQFATVSTLGIIRVGGTPEYDLTVDIQENAAQLSAARIVERILQRAGFTTSDYDVAELNALHDLNPSIVGTWVGTEKTDFLSVINVVLSAIGGYMTPDRFGVFRFGRFELPSGNTIMQIGPSLILAGSDGVRRITTNDQGNGLPAKKVTLKYAFNYTIQKGSSVAGGASAASKAFIAESWRNAVIEDEDVGEIYLMAQELEFESALINEAAATAEAERRFEIYKEKRDRYIIPVKSEYVSNIDLNDEILLRFNRYGLNSGRAFRVIGMTEDFGRGVTTLDVFG